MGDPIHVQLLGPVRIGGGTAPPFSDRGHGLVELVAWLSLHPEGVYGCQIDRDLVWATTSRLSALSRIRRWLGPGALPRGRAGHPYRLHAVTDWSRAAGPIVDERGSVRPDASTEALVAALRHVRGVPLADIAAPWADAPRLAMVLLLRDAAAELLRRPDVNGALRGEVQVLAGQLLPSDRLDSAGCVA